MITVYCVRNFGEKTLDKIEVRTLNLLITTGYPAHLSPYLRTFCSDSMFPPQDDPGVINEALWLVISPKLEMDHVGTSGVLFIDIG